MSGLSWILAYLLAASLTTLWFAVRGAQFHADEVAELALVAVVWPIVPVLIPAAKAWHRRKRKKARR